jgi:hypothetical protein
MRYRTRLVLLVTVLLASAVIVISGLLAWNTRNALLASAEESGQMVANLLARSAALANEIPNEVEEMLGAQMVAEARIVAHFVDAAEKANFTPDEINRRLRQLADTTVLDEFWITDEKVHAYLRNIDVDFTFSPSALEQSQAHVFWPLLLGKRDQVIQEARRPTPGRCGREPPSSTASSSSSGSVIFSPSSGCADRVRCCVIGTPIVGRLSHPPSKESRRTGQPIHTSALQRVVTAHFAPRPPAKSN